MVYLVVRTAQGDQRTFKQLYDLTAPRLFAVARAIVKERQLAEDVLQEAYVQVWHRSGDYHVERGKVITWLISILRYRAIDATRRRKTVQSTPVEELEMVAEESASQPDFFALASEDAQALRDCLDSLTGSQRTSITLAYFQGLTHYELSRHLTIPIGTAKSRIRRGLARLKECLEL